MSKIAKLQEHGNIDLRDMGGNGTLPGVCPLCGKIVDFKDKNTLKCRECNWFLKLEEIK